MVKQNNIKKKRECLICTDNIKEMNMVVLECCHVYHTNCVKMLIKKRTRKCPLCRTKIIWNLKQLDRHIKLTNEKFNKE